MRQGPRQPQELHSRHGREVSREGAELDGEGQESLAGEARAGQDFFQIQAEFALAASKIKRIPFEEALSHCTSMFNVLAREMPSKSRDDRDAIRRSWDDLLARSQVFVEAGNAEGIARIAYEKYNRPGERNISPEHHFGCFSYSVRPARSRHKPGEISIHFSNRDSQGGGPLSPEKIEKRKRELHDMFKEIRDLYPQGDRTINGSSWLYNLARYKEIFAKEYQESLHLPESVESNEDVLAYGGLWFQFLKSDGSANRDAWTLFSKRIAAATTEAELLEAFPLKVLLPRAPAAVFFRMEWSTSTKSLTPASDTENLQKGLDYRIVPRMSQDQLFKLACGKCSRINYWSRKNRKLVTRKVELKKYCKWCKAHTKHKEAKK